MRIITCDLDSTVCNTSERFAKHGGEAGRASIDWAKYAQDCAMDQPFDSVITLVRMLSRTVDGVYFVSQRDGSALEATREWLRRPEHFGSGQFASANILGIKLDDHRYMGRHGVYKAMKIKELQEAGHDVKLHIDDYPEVKTAVEKLCKVPVVVVNPAYEGSKADLR